MYDTYSVLELVLDQGEEWKISIVRSVKMNIKHAFFPIGSWNPVFFKKQWKKY